MMQQGMEGGYVNVVSSSYLLCFHYSIHAYNSYYFWHILNILAKSYESPLLCIIPSEGNG